MKNCTSHSGGFDGKKQVSKFYIFPSFDRSKSALFRQKICFSPRFVHCIQNIPYNFVLFFYLLQLILRLTYVKIYLHEYVFLLCVRVFSRAYAYVIFLEGCP